MTKDDKTKYYSVFFIVFCILAGGAFFIYNGTVIVKESKKIHHLSLHKNTYFNTTTFIYRLENDNPCIYSNTHQVKLLSSCMISFSTKNPDYEQVCIPFEDIQCEPNILTSGIMYIVVGSGMCIIVICVSIIQFQDIVTNKRKYKIMETGSYTEMV